MSGAALPPGPLSSAADAPGPPTSSPGTPADGLPPGPRLLAMTTVLLGIAMTVLDAAMLNLALPAIVHDLRIAEADAVWLVNAYQLAILVLLLPLALLGDLLGYRRVYLTGVGVFMAAALACLLADGPGTLAAARALQGAGAAGLFAVNAALVRRIYPASLLGRGIAFNSAVVSIASVAGPALGAAVLSLAHWHWLFALNIPMAALVLALGWRSLPANATRPQAGLRFPWADAVLNGAMFLLLFIGLQRFAPHGALPAAPALAAALVAAGLATGAVYVRRQLAAVRAGRTPLLPVDLLAIPVFRLSMLTSVASFAAQTLASVALPFLLLVSLGRTPAEAGWVLAAWPLGSVLAAPVAARLIGRQPSGLLGGIGLGLLAAGLLALALLPTHATPLAMAWRLGLCGVGFALFQAPNNHTIVTSAPSHRAGGAAGMLGTARLTGQSLGALCMGALYGLWAAAPGRVPALALGVAAGLALLGSAFSLLRVREQVQR